MVTAPAAPQAGVGPALPFPSQMAERLVRAAETQVGVTRGYDGAYVQLAFPGGDVAPETGVCSDVLIRAMRLGWRIDLQLAVNRDMRKSFAAYPARWGLSAPDTNIDHRRVPNLETLFKRIGAELPQSSDPAAYLPGDIVTWRLPGNHPHVGIVTDHLTGAGGNPMIVHNVGAGTRVEDALFEWEIVHHFRLTGPAMDRLAALAQPGQ